MSVGTQTVIVGVFTDQADAQTAINELKQLGFRDDQIGVATRSDEPISGARPVIKHRNPATEGAIIGASGGALVGALWGLGIVAGALPAVGPVIAGGTLAAILASAATAAAVAGIAGALIDWGLPEEHAHFYDQEFKAGRTVVTVHADDRHAEVSQLFQRSGAFDFANRSVGSTSPAAPFAVAATINEARNPEKTVVG